MIIIIKYIKLEIEIKTWRAAMPTAPPITDRTAGCISSFLVDHHKMPTEIRVAVASIRWSSCSEQCKTPIRTSCCENFGRQTTLMRINLLLTNPTIMAHKVFQNISFSSNFSILEKIIKIHPKKSRKQRYYYYLSFSEISAWITCTVDVFSKKFRIKGFISKMSSGIHVSPIFGKVLKACPWE